MDNLDELAAMKDQHQQAIADMYARELEFYKRVRAEARRPDRVYALYAVLLVALIGFAIWLIASSPIPY